MRPLAPLCTCIALAALAASPVSSAARSAPARAAACSRALAPAGSATIQISEVEADPVLSGTDTAKEWLELTNVGASSLTLTNWTISDSAATDALPTVTLWPGRCVVVAASSSGFLAEHAGYAQPFLSLADGAIGNGLSNGGDLLTLQNESGGLVDCVAWGTATGCFGPSAPAPVANTSATLQRASSIDTDSAADWTAAAETPCSVAPTAVRVVGLAAARVGRSVVRLSWRAPAASLVLGFRVWRGAGSGYRKLTKRLIGVHASGGYRFLDRVGRASRTLRYRLEVVGLDGRSEWVGPVRVGVPGRPARGS